MSCQCQNTRARRARLRAWGFVVNGIVVDEELNGPDGMNFFLMLDGSESVEQKKKARRQLRRDRDAIRIYQRKPCVHE